MATTFAFTRPPYTVRDDPRQGREKPLPLSGVLAPFKGNAQCVWKVRMLRAFGIDTSKARWRRKPTGPTPTEGSPSSAAEGNGSDDTYESPSVDGDSAAASGGATSSPPPPFLPLPPPIPPQTVNCVKKISVNVIPVVSRMWSRM